MENILDLNIFNESEFFLSSIDYEKELSTIFEEYDNLIDNHLYFSEAIADTQRTVDNQFRKIMQNTAQTTKDVYDAYDITTDIGGNILSAGWKLAMKLLNLALKAVQVVSNLIIAIPKTLEKLITKVENFAKRFGNKIGGNLSLWLTYDDINYINNKLIFNTINEIISGGIAMSEDKMWLQLEKGKGKANDTAFKICSRIIKNRLRIKNIQFKVTTVDLSNVNMRDLYLGMNIQGNGTSTYLGSLQAMIKSIESHKDDLDKIGNAFRSKYQESIRSGKFAKVEARSQKLIQMAIQDVSKTVIDLSKIVTYANKDIKSVWAAVDMVNKKNEKKTK